MGLISRIAAAVYAFKSTGSSDDPRWWQEIGYSSPSVTGIHITQSTALSASAVMAAVTMLSEDIAKLDWSVFRRAKDGSQEEAQDHYLYDLIQQPNEWQNGFEFREQMQVALVLRGNAYAVIMRNGRGRPVRLVPVNPDWVMVWISPDGSIFYRVTRTDIHVRAILGNLPELIPAADMLHVRGFSMNGLVGASRISMAREAIALFLAQEQQAARWMGNAAKPSGMLTTDQKLTPDAAKRLAADFKESSAGLQNSGKVIVGEQGLKFLPFSMTSSDLEFIASRQFQLQEIARIFRIPPHMIGELSRSTNNNITQQAQEYVNYTLTGYTQRWRDKFSSTFGLRQDGVFVHVDFSIMTEADVATRYANYRIGIMSMFLTPDEARISDKRKPMGGKAAELQQPLNMAELGSQSSGTLPDGGGRPAASSNGASKGNGHAANFEAH